MANNRILLIEPGYKNKYPQLGLMKLAQYHGPRGKRDHVVFIEVKTKPYRAGLGSHLCDDALLVRVPEDIRTIDFALRVARGHRDKVFVGGIAASLMHERFSEQRRWQGIRVIKGLLNKAPAIR